MPFRAVNPANGRDHAIQFGSVKNRYRHDPSFVLQLPHHIIMIIVINGNITAMAFGRAFVFGRSDETTPTFPPAPRLPYYARCLFRALAFRGVTG